MKFGAFDHMDLGSESVADLYEGRLSIAERCDEAGFYGYHVAEHHGTEHGLLHSPNIYLAALAQRTRQIKIGSLVHLLPLYEPLRLVEEFAMLDQMSRGRLQIGVGRGISPYEVGYFGVTPGESRSRFHEVLDFVIDGLQTDLINYESQRFQYYEVPMIQRPVQNPYPPLWVGAHNENSLNFAAQYGCNIVIGGPNHAAKRAAERYPELWQKHKNMPRRINSPVQDPFIGGWRFIYIADSDAEAIATAAPAFKVHMDRLAAPSRAWGYMPNVHIDNFETALELGIHIAGSPATVRERLARDISETGVNYFMLSIAWGGLTIEQSLRSLNLFVDEIMPHFKDAEAAKAAE